MNASLPPLCPKNEPMRRLISILLFLALSCVLAHPVIADADPPEKADFQPPRFEDYPGAPPYQGPRADARLASKADRSFRTRIRHTKPQPVDFSGEYVVTACLMGVAVNARTGAVAWFPGSVCCWRGEGERVVFRPGSRLLALKGLINEEGAHGIHF
jgi:hypothetical protein